MTTVHENVRHLLETGSPYDTASESAWMSPRTAELVFSPPPEISLYCGGDSCGKTQNWSADQGDENLQVGLSSSTFVMVRYHCKNCPKGKERITAFALEVVPEARGSGMYWLIVEKFGQSPPAEEIIPSELNKALDKTHRDLYRKAIRCRKFGYGIGAAIYIRRVVEDSMDALLDLLIANTSDDELRKKAGDAKAGFTFDEKARFAALILPSRLIRDGQNPIERLHHWTSSAVHSLSEAESNDVFDRIRTVFEMLFIILEHERQGDSRWREAMNFLVSKNPGS